MPPTADVLLLVGLLFDQGNLRMLTVRLEEPVDIDITPAFGKCDVIQLTEALITEKKKSMTDERRLDRLKLLITQLP